MEWRSRLSPMWLVPLLIAFDAGLKWWIHTSIPLMYESSPWYPFGGIGVFEGLWGVDFSITHHTNSGAAWGLLGDYPTLLLVVRVILIGALHWYLIIHPFKLAMRVGFLLVIAGALGNVLDIFVYGHVVDMFNFDLWGYDYPVFNLADICICTGIGWIMVRSLIDDIHP